MDTADAMASKAYLDAVAARLRAGGLAGSARRAAGTGHGRPHPGPQPPGPPHQTRRRRRRASAPGSPTANRSCPTARPRTLRRAAAPGGRRVPPNPDAWSGRTPTVTPRLRRRTRRPGPRIPARRSDPGPLPALINLIVPAGTLLGWSSTPAQAGAWGLLDRDETRTVVTAAAQHPRTRWCVTLTAPDGTAVAHACARGPRPACSTTSNPSPRPPSSPNSCAA